MKYFVKTLEEVDEALRGHYEKVEGGFRLKVEGVVEKSRLDEFRENNLALKKQIEEREAKLKGFEGIDPEKYRQFEQQQVAQRDKKLLDAGQIDELINHRTADMRRAHEEQVNTLGQTKKQLEDQLGAYRSELSQLKIDTNVQAAISKVGRLRQGAMDDALFRAHRDLQLDESGKLKVREGLISVQGDAIRSIDDWAKNLLGTASHLFEPGGGGGAGGGTTQRGGGGTLIDNNPLTIGDNLEAIATGKATVRL